MGIQKPLDFSRGFYGVAWLTILELLIGRPYIGSFAYFRVCLSDTNNRGSRRRANQVLTKITMLDTLLPSATNSLIHLTP